jgi:hypothetical protein
MKTSNQPFHTIESTEQYLALLGETIEEALQDARRELSACKFTQELRRVQAWQMVVYTASKLSAHIANSRKLMRDLDVLRQVLEEARSAAR